MGIEWLAGMFDVAGSWRVWLLLAGALVLCWGLVIAVTSTLFGTPARRGFTPVTRRGKTRVPAATVHERDGIEHG